MKIESIEWSSHEGVLLLAMDNGQTMVLKNTTLTEFSLRGEDRRINRLGMGAFSAPRDRMVSLEFVASCADVLDTGDGE